MTIFLRTFLLLLVSSSVGFSQQQNAPQAPPSFVLTLTNGSSFLCQLNEQDQEAGFLSGLSQELIQFDFEQIQSLTPVLEEGLGGLSTQDESAANKEGILILENGEHLTGKLISLNSKELVVESSLGKLSILPSKVQQIFSYNESKLLYFHDATQENDLWERGGRVQQIDGLLSFARSAQVMIPEVLPTAYQIELESPTPLEELSMDLNLHVNLRGDSDQNTYFLQFRPGGTVELRATKDFAIANDFNPRRESVLEEKNLLIDAAAKKNSSRIVISVDRTTGTMLLRVNNGLPISFDGLAKVQDNLDIDDFLQNMQNNNFNRMRIDYFGFNPDSCYFTIRPNTENFALSRIRIWAQEAGSSAPMGFASDASRRSNRNTGQESYLYLNNGDALLGQITGMDEEFYRIRVQGIEIPVPRSKVSEVSFLTQDNTQVVEQDSNEALFQVRLRDGSILKTSLKKFTPNGFIASSSAISSELNIPLSECLNIERIPANRAAQEELKSPLNQLPLTSLSELIESQTQPPSRQVEYLGLPEN